MVSMSLLLLFLLENSYPSRDTHPDAAVQDYHSSSVLVSDGPSMSKV